MSRYRDADSSRYSRDGDSSRYRDSDSSRYRDSDSSRYRDSDSSRHRDADPGCKLYVGDLPRDAVEKDLERLFDKFGPLRSVWVARKPPGFAFIEYEEPRDADDAVRDLDGSKLLGSIIRVEHASGRVKPKPWLKRGPSRPRRPFNTDDKCYECGKRGHYAYDCTSRSRRGGGGYRSSKRSHSRSRSRSRSVERPRKRSYSRSRSRSVSRNHSRSPKRYTRERSRSASRENLRDRSQSRGASRSRSRSISRKDD